MILADAITGALALWSLTLWGALATAWRNTAINVRQASATKAENGVPAQSRIVIVRPCAGDDPALRDNLLSISPHLENTRIRLLHTVAHDDPGRGIVAAATHMLQSRGIDAACLITHPSGANHKVAQLAEAQTHPATHGIAIWTCIDCDVRLDGFQFPGLWAPLAPNGVTAATWAPFCEQASPIPGRPPPQSRPIVRATIHAAIGLETKRPAARFAARCSEAILNGSLHSFALLAGLDPHTVVGKVFAIRADSLRAIGGWATLADYLGEDMQLGIHLREMGQSVQVVSQVARSVAMRRPFASVLQRYVRWLLVIRGQRPALLMSYPFVFFATFPLLVASVFLAARAPTRRHLVAALVVTAVAATGRLAAAVVARLRCGDTPSCIRAVSDSFLADGLLMLATWRALISRRVAWRGRWLRVEQGGKLVAVAPRPRNAETC